MRRLILVLVLIAVPGMAILVPHGSVPAVRAATHSAKSKPKRETCTKIKKGHKEGSCTARKAAKKSAKKASKKSKKKTRKAAGHAVPTRTPTATDTPTATPTFTPTSTPTLTPTPLPSLASMPVQADLPAGYRAGFFVCGLPSGITASFSSNPASAVGDGSSPTGAAAHTSLTVSVPWGTPAGAYGLAIHAYFQDQHGLESDAPPGGGSIVPAGAELTVSSGGTATLAVLSPPPALGLQDCTSPPPGFGPLATVTPNPGDVQLFSWVSDAHPSPGELETVNGSFKLAGQPVAGVPMHTVWYLPYGVQSCDGTTDSTGVASCSLVMERTFPGQTVQIQVIFTFNGQQYITNAYFST